MPLRQILIILLFLVAGCLTVVAQDAESHGWEKTPRTTVSAAPVISSYQNDFGFGFELMSPNFAGGALAVSVSGKMNYLATADWKPYFNGEISLISGLFAPVPTHRLYGKAGLVAIFPTDDVSDDEMILGALGAFGFEFFFTEERGGSYFIELGGVGIGAEADNVPGSPVYANGFLTNVGVRYYF
jgi:hypothetical protein